MRLDGGVGSPLYHRARLLVIATAPWGHGGTLLRRRYSNRFLDLCRRGGGWWGWLMAFSVRVVGLSCGNAIWLAAVGFSDTSLWGVWTPKVLWGGCLRMLNLVLVYTEWLLKWSDSFTCTYQPTPWLHGLPSHV